MVQDYCLIQRGTTSFGRKVPFFKKNAASFQGFLHNLSGYCLLNKKFLKGKLQTNDICFFASRGSFVVVFNFTFRTKIQYKFMLHITYTYIPFKGRLYFFSGKPCISEKTTRYFARDSGMVHATISMLLRCKYFPTFLFLNYAHS